MIHGVGMDLVEVYRMRKILHRWKYRFIERCFTESEKSYCERQRNAALHYAARFAAKEAFLKSLGIGLMGGVSVKEIEVSRGTSGAPELKIVGRASELMRQKGVKASHVSMSHTERYASAIVMLEM